MKTFRIKVRAYGYWADFTVQASEEGKPLEDSIIDKLGKNDIKWEKSDFYDQRRTWLTYEEIVNDTRPLQTKNVLGVELATRV
jgi:hypothetical protein|tara:strand:- start:331 stop:579 length:249 start_codon:yes stop_codon:yes gene_type:complete